MSRLTASVLTLVPAAFLLAAQHGPAPIKVHGTFSMKYDQQFRAPVGDTAEHLLVAFSASGTNKGMGDEDPLEGAQVRHYFTSDMTRGTGSQTGYSVKWSGSDSLFDRVQGRFVTTVGKDGTPRTAGDGSFESIRGTGKFEGVKVKGTYTMRMTGADTYVVEWAGELTPGRRRVAER